MKQVIAYFAFLLCPLIGMAQENESTIQPADSLSVPLVAPIPESGGYIPFCMYGITPFHCGYASWELHEGLNASFGMNVTFSPSRYAPSGVGFGQDAAFFYARPLTKRFSMAAGLYASNMSWGGLNYRNIGFARYAPSGVGFGQDAAFFYARPLTKRFSMAAGLYASNMSWGGLNYRNIGFAAIAGFQVNERISLYAYGTKSFMPKRSPLYYPLPNFDPDRFGGMVRFKLGESSSVNERISLYAYGTKSFMPKRSPLYYPLPNFDPDRFGGMVRFKLGESSSFSIGVEGLRYPGIRPIY